MNEIDVLLITPPTSKNYKKKMADKVSMPPLGQLYIASNLKKFNFTVELIDMSVSFYTKNEFVKKLKMLNPRIIGLSTFIESWDALKLLATIIKETLPNVVLIAGGSCATFLYENMLKDLNYDYVIFGEGEFTFLDICDSVIRSIGDIKSIDGIAFIDSGGVVKTRCRSRIANLDGLCFPDRSLINLENYAYPITISTSRGCPGKCIFCSSKSFWGEKIYFRSCENILEEIIEIEKKLKVNSFFIVDDTFTANQNRVVQFCNLLKTSGKSFVWGCESRADIVNEDLIKILYDSGCRKIQFGMESSSNDILKKIGKNVTIEQIENSVSLASNYGISVNVSFIIGHPFDTDKTITNTIKFALYLKDKYDANVIGSILTPYPGTDIYENANSYGIEILTSDFNRYTMNESIINTKYLTANDLRTYYNNFLNYTL